MYDRSSPTTLSNLYELSPSSSLFQVAADGRLSDELIGEGNVHVVGEASSRLMRGDRVTINVSLTASSKLLAPNAIAPVASGMFISLRCQVERCMINL